MISGQSERSPTARSSQGNAWSTSPSPVVQDGDRERAAAGALLPREQLPQDTPGLISLPASREGVTAPP